MLEAQECWDLSEGWSAGRKTEIVFRLFQGEDLRAVRGAVQVLEQELEE